MPTESTTSSVQNATDQGSPVRYLMPHHGLANLRHAFFGVHICMSQILHNSHGPGPSHVARSQPCAIPHATTSAKSRSLGTHTNTGDMGRCGVWWAPCRWTPCADTDTHLPGQQGKQCFHAQPSRSASCRCQSAGGLPSWFAWRGSGARWGGGQVGMEPEEEVHKSAAFPLAVMTGDYTDPCAHRSCHVLGLCTPSPPS